MKLTPSLSAPSAAQLDTPPCASASSFVWSSTVKKAAVKNGAPSMQSPYGLSLMLSEKSPVVSFPESSMPRAQLVIGIVTVTDAPSTPAKEVPHLILILVLNTCHIYRREKSLAVTKRSTGWEDLTIALSKANQSFGHIGGWKQGETDGQEEWIGRLQ